MIFSNSNPGLSYLGINKDRSKTKGKIQIKNDLYSIIYDLMKFNLSLDIKTSCLDISEFDAEEIINSGKDSELKEEIKNFIEKNSLKLYFFIGKDYFLASKIEEVKTTTISLVNRISEILNDLEIYYPSIFLRIGSAYGNRKLTMEDFCKSVSNLSENTVKRIAIMNDDKPSLFSVTDLLTGIYYETNIPICFRVLPHQFNDGGLSIREALFLSSSTWNNGLKPVIFYSESSEQDPNGIAKSVKPSEFLTRRIPTFGLSFDIIIDSPMKEDSCLLYRMQSKSLPPVVINKI